MTQGQPIPYSGFIMMGYERILIFDTDQNFNQSKLLEIRFKLIFPANKLSIQPPLNTRKRKRQERVSGYQIHKASHLQLQFHLSQDFPAAVLAHNKLFIYFKIVLHLNIKTLNHNKRECPKCPITTKGKYQTCPMVGRPHYLEENKCGTDAAYKRKTCQY